MVDAVRARDGDVIVDVDVKPSADESAFPSGYNPWRERIEGSVAAPAKGGRANQALCRLVAEVLDVDSARVGLLRGHTSRRKTLLIRDVTVGRVEAALGDVIDA